MGALENVRVLDLSRFQSGPVCGMMLGDMGAEVIRVEEPGGAPDRSWGLLGPDGETLSYKIVGRSRKGITLDLNADEGKKIFRRLAKVSDVILHNYTPGIPLSADLDYAKLKRTNNKIIVAAISGFGQNGPDAKLTCFDHVAQARSGGMLLTGFPGDPPLKTTITYNDISSGLLACIGILTALYHREKTGKGQFIDVALYDMAFFSTQLMGALALYKVYGEIRRQVGNLGFHSYIGVCEAKDGNWVLISGATNGIWKRLTRAIGHEEMAVDPKFGKNDMVRFDNAKSIDPILADWVSKRTAEEVIKVLQKERVPCSIVNSVDRTLNDSQVQAREMIVNVEYPGIGQIPLPGFPLKMSRTPGGTSMRAPAVGEHNKEVYGILLGFNETELRRLKENGVI